MRAQGFAQPPVGNTGGICPERPTCGIDYLRGTIPVTSSADCRALIEAVFEEELNIKIDDNGDPVQMGFYRYVETTPNGILYQSLHRLYDALHPKQHQLLTLSGKPLARLTPDALEMLLVGLASIGFKPTRLDLKLDDYSKTVTPDLAYQAAVVGNTKGFQRYRRVQSDDGGYTFYGGTRGSDRGGKYLRIYDKTVESKNQIDATRIEVELSSDKAAEAFDKLTTVPLKLWPRLIASMIVGAYNFIDRSDGKKAYRCDQLDWWAAVLCNKKGYSFCPVTRDPSFKKKVKWLLTQVSRSFALVAEAIDMADGVDNSTRLPAFLHELWQIGYSKLTPDDRHEIAVYAGQCRSGYQELMSALA